jgi:ubiquinone/menaquinone biosynthesis C-methylase UbiE
VAFAAVTACLLVASRGRLAEAIVARARERAGAERAGARVQFELADAAALTLADASFDAAVSTLSLHDWADPAGVIRDVARVVRPGGIALIYDPRPVAS